MAENGSSKPQSVPSKSFMTAGPALHYSHTNVHLCWGLSIAVYLIACFFWSRLLIGEDLSVSLLGLFRPELWNIGRFVDVVQGFLKQSQFIVITHNRKTISEANALFGVTMEERGISKIVSVRFNRDGTPVSDTATDPTKADSVLSSP